MALRLLSAPSSLALWRGSALTNLVQSQGEGGLVVAVVRASKSRPHRAWQVGISDLARRTHRIMIRLLRRSISNQPGPTCGPNQNIVAKIVNAYLGLGLLRNAVPWMGTCSTFSMTFSVSLSYSKARIRTTSSP